MRAGILGGTFDPVHLGHLRAAEEVGEALDLDKVYLIPAALPPHKEVIPVTPFDRRFEMLCLAVGDDPLLQPLDLEGRRLGISYSIDSLKELHALHTPDLDLFFIIGLDAFIPQTLPVQRRGGPRCALP